MSGIDPFYVIDLAVDVLLAGALFYRFRNTKVRYYLYFAIGVLAEAVASGLLAFLSNSFGLVTLSIIVIYSSLIIYMIANLIFILCVLHMFQAWVRSMRNAPRPSAIKLEKATKLSRILWYIYPALTCLLVLFFVLVVVTLAIAAVLATVTGVAYAVSVVAQLSVTIWLWLDVQHNTGNPSETRKRDQLVRIGAMTFFAAWPSMLSGLGAGIGSSICWWVFFGIALWPNALIGFDEEPQMSPPAAAYKDPYAAAAGPGSGLEGGYPNKGMYS